MLRHRVRGGAGHRDRARRQGLPAQPARGLVHLVHQRGRRRSRPKSAAQGAALRQVMANPRGDKPPQLQADDQRDRQGAPRAWSTRPRTSTRPAPSRTPQREPGHGARVPRDRPHARSPQNLPTLLQGSDPQTKAAGIAKPMQRFLASDVIYDDSFKGPAMQALREGRHHRRRGAAAPGRSCRTPALASAEGAKTLHPGPVAAHGSSSGGTDDEHGQPARHLAGVDRRHALGHPPHGRARTATVQATELLKWSVTVKNGGDFDETQRDRAGLVLLPGHAQRRRHARGLDPVDRLSGEHRLGRDARARRPTRSSSATRAP